MQFATTITETSKVEQIRIRRHMQAEYSLEFRVPACWGRTHAHPAQRSLDRLTLLRAQLCRLVERLRRRTVLNTHPCT